MLTERAPYGVILAITPTTNPTETILCNAHRHGRRRQRGGVQRPPVGGADSAPGSCTCSTRRSPPAGGPRGRGHLRRRADHRERAGADEAPGHPPGRRHRRPRGGQGGDELAARRSSPPARATRRRSSTRPPTSTRPRAASCAARRSTTTSSASPRRRSSPSTSIADRADAPARRRSRLPAARRAADARAREGRPRGRGTSTRSGSARTPASSPGRSGSRGHGDDLRLLVVRGRRAAPVRAARAADAGHRRWCASRTSPRRIAVRAARRARLPPHRDDVLDQHRQHVGDGAGRATASIFVKNDAEPTPASASAARATPRSRSPARPARA